MKPSARVRTYGTAMAGAALLSFCLLPFLGQLFTSLRPDSELGRWSLEPLTWDNYLKLLGRPDFLRAVVNSFSVALLSTFLCLTLAASGAFALGRLKLRGSSWILASVLAVSMFPTVSTVSPLYLIVRALRLLDQLWGLALPYVTFALPLALWTLTSFFRDLPDELYRAARVDGCSPIGAFLRVFLPLAGPGLATTGLLVFISSWNEFLYALTFISSPERRTLPVAVSLFATDQTEPWGEIMAASTVATLPLLWVTLLFQRRIVAGLTAGAVKG